MEKSRFNSSPSSRPQNEQASEKQWPVYPKLTKLSVVTIATRWGLLFLSGIEEGTLASMEG